MSAATSVVTPLTARASVAPQATLDGLLARSPAELERMYVGARVPRLADVRGDLRGRMLAWPSLAQRPGVAGAIRAFAGSRAFPWRGKSFTPHSALRGEGTNRIVTDRFRLFRFETFVGPSRAGDFDAVQLDYDLPENPFFIRRIKDEIREIERNVWLGQAWFATGSREWLWLYFALAKVD